MVRPVHIVLAGGIAALAALVLLWQGPAEETALWGESLPGVAVALRQGGQALVEETSLSPQAPGNPEAPQRSPVPTDQQPPPPTMIPSKGRGALLVLPPGASQARLTLAGEADPALFARPEERDVLELVVGRFFRKIASDDLPLLVVSQGALSEGHCNMPNSEALLRAMREESLSKEEEGKLFPRFKPTRWWNVNLSRLGEDLAEGFQNQGKERLIRWEVMAVGERRMERLLRGELSAMDLRSITPSEERTLGSVMRISAVSFDRRGHEALLYRVDTDRSGARGDMLHLQRSGQGEWEFKEIVPLCRHSYGHGFDL